MNKKTFKQGFVLLLLLFSCAVLHAQSNLSTQITARQDTAIRKRAQQKVEQLIGNLAVLSNKINTSPKTKEMALRNTLKLFIGRGDPYRYWNEELNRYDQKEAVKIQTSSVNRSSSSSQPLKRYLTRLKDNATYTQIEIQSVDMVRIDNIYEVGDGKYEAVAYFSQKFIGYRENRIIYADVTEKKVKVHIDRNDIPGGGVQWDIKLGDIYVIETRRAY